MRSRVDWVWWAAAFLVWSDAIVAPQPKRTVERARRYLDAGKP